MPSIRKIICATDFSDPSLAGVRRARELAQENGAELILVHVMEPLQANPTVDPMAGISTSTFDVGTYFEEMTEGAQRTLAAMAEREKPAGGSIRTEVLHGKVANEIAKLADREDADLIVIGKHGHSGWQDRIFGSTAEKIVRHTERSVMVVPAGPVGKGPGR
jgi:nucleotide-binding universal stress UspA family protein